MLFNIDDEDEKELDKARSHFLEGLFQRNLQPDLKIIRTADCAIDGFFSLNNGR